MLKGHKKANLVSFEPKNLEKIQFVLSVLDLVEGTIYSKIFFYVYLYKEKMSMEEIVDELNMVLNTLKYQLNKINLIILAVSEYK